MLRTPCLALLLATALVQADLVEANRDAAVAPTKDFWLHANGCWNQTHPIPADRAVYNSFAWQDDLIKKDLLAINADLLSKQDANGDQRRLADFWRSALGFEHGPAELPAGLRAVLAKLDEAQTPQALLDASAALYAEGTGSFLGIYAAQDKKDETTVALHLWQSGLSLPERAFYFSNEPATKRVRDAFPAHVAKMLGFLGYDAARAQRAGAAVLAFEVKLAEVSLPMVQLRNPDAHYHPMTGWRLGRPAGQGIRRPPFFSGPARTLPARLRERADRLRRPHPQAGVDGCGHAGLGLAQARRHQAARGLSR
ncbi:MAG: hypothetical protein EBR62_02770 [Verrucomicrobia bacterium]|nr:hypothetical protein [Verrucomicrobiota bacterium]